MSMSEVAAQLSSAETVFNEAMDAVVMAQTQITIGQGLIQAAQGEWTSESLTDAATFASGAFGDSEATLKSLRVTISKMQQVLRNMSS